jgi:hypothetical protein
MSERLTTTVKHFKDGVLSMGLAAAKHSIESWQEELRGYEGTGFKTIVTDLGHLHDELGKDEINGKKVGQLLTKLGKETSKCAKEAGDKGDTVAELGDLLSKAGSDLDAEKATAAK